jgi:hypothetical protein
VVIFLNTQQALQAMASKVPGDWMTIEVAEKFTLKAPPGSAHVPGRGIDSLIGKIRTPGFTLDFDYGAYSDSLKTQAAYQQYSVREMQIDGKAARIVTAFAPGKSADRPYFIGVHFPNLGRSVIGPIRLTMTAWVKAPKEFEAIEALFGTITFK